MTTRTPTAAQDLATRLYGVDARIEMRLYQDDTYPQTMRHAVSLALTGVRTAEEKMTGAAYWIRGDMERVERAVTDGTSAYGASIARNAAEFDTAATLRETHMASLAALLGEDEMTAWKAAKVTARTAPADESK